MTRTEQSEFVVSLIDAVSEEIQMKIGQEKIPETWDGIELRQYIADKMRECVWDRMNPKRKKDYLNSILVNNL